MAQDYFEPEWFPIIYLQHMSRKHALLLWKQSYEAVIRVAQAKPEKCPTCQGHGRLGSFIRGGSPIPFGIGDCPHCHGKGVVTWPIWGLECFEGGWDCCPVCGEGQHQDPDVPCEVCCYWLFKLSVTLPKTDQKEENANATHT